jgi:hypothetical protein
MSEMVVLHERNDLLHERNDLLHERNDLLHERNDLLHERNDLLHERNDLLADKLLVKMDAISNLAQKSEPAFVDEYNSKRIIVKTASRTRALQIEVLNDATGEPFANAKVTFKAKTGGAELQKNVKAPVNRAAQPRIY